MGVQGNSLPSGKAPLADARGTGALGSRARGMPACECHPYPSPLPAASGEGWSDDLSTRRP
jgi:hypothetical protein